MPVLLLFVVFVVVPLAELYLIIQIGEAIGVLPTVGLLLLDSILGTLLMRSQGRAVWARLHQALGEGRMPAREVADGFLVLLGGALLLAPGFLTDVLGVLLLVPPTRAVIRPVLLRVALRRMAGRPEGRGGGVRFGFGGSGSGGPTAPRGFGRPGPPDDGVVDGTAHDVDPRRLG